MKSKESSGMSSFLKRKDPNLDALKSQYFTQPEENTKSAFKKPDKKFTHWSDVESYIDKRRREYREKISYRA
jgi:hypothetical protein